MLDKSVPAVLLRIDPGPCHHATLGVVRSSGGRTGVGVRAVTVSQGSFLRRSGCMGAERPAPGQGVSLEEIGAAPRRVPASVAGPALLIPMGFAGAVAVSRSREELLTRRGPRATPRAGSGFESRGPGHFLADLTTAADSAEGLTPSAAGGARPPVTASRPLDVGQVTGSAAGAFAPVASFGVTVRANG